VTTSRPARRHQNEDHGAGRFSILDLLEQSGEQNGRNQQCGRGAQHRAGADRHPQRQLPTGRGCPGCPAFEQQTEQDQRNGRYVGHDLVAKLLVSRVEPDGEGTEQGEQPADSTALVHEEQHDASGSEEADQRVQVAKIGRALTGYQG